jgi:release factor glutamine methyltransferase
LATIESIYLKIATTLIPVALDLSKTEAQEIIENYLNLNHADFFNILSTEISNENCLEIDKIVNERLKGIPLAYVLENQFFFSKDFKLSNATLIPRHDTEHLIDEIITKENSSNLLFLELGTGSGIIPEIITSELPKSKAISVDFSVDALNIAKENCSTKITLIASDRFSALKPNRQFDFIVSNPPYIPTKIVEGLESSVIDYEPLTALDGGDDGLDFYRYLAKDSKEYLKDG